MGNFPQPDSDLDLGPVQMPSLDYIYAGNVVFLGSGDATAGIMASSAPLVDGSSRDRPVASFAAAKALCLANRNDTIYALPSYAETIVGAAGMTMSKPGLTLRGLSGRGGRRPTITFTTAAGASFDMIADGCTVENVVFVNDINAQTAMINVKSAGAAASAADCTIRNCELRMTKTLAATKYALIGILINSSTTNDCDRTKVEDCIITGSGAGAAAGTVRHTNAIQIIGGDGIQIYGGQIRGRFSATLGNIQVITTATTNLRIGKGSDGRSLFMSNSTTAGAKTFVDTIGGSTGFIDGTRNQILSGTAPFTGTTMSLGNDNFYIGTIATAMVVVASS